MKYTNDENIITKIDTTYNFFSNYYIFLLKKYIIENRYFVNWLLCEFCIFTLFFKYPSSETPNLNIFYMLMR
jgi:hypothetical protein